MVKITHLLIFAQTYPQPVYIWLAQGWVDFSELGSYSETQIQKGWHNMEGCFEVQASLSLDDLNYQNINIVRSPCNK